MNLWRAFVGWTVQLVAIGGLVQFLCWAYGVDEEVTHYLSIHKDWLTVALIAYFCSFAIFYPSESERSKAKAKVKALSKKMDEEK
jgi:hypothetical protein